MSTMTQPLSYEIIIPRGYVMDMITHKVRCEHWTAIINECLASGMPKNTWCKPMASPINNSFTGRKFSGRKLINRWNLKALLLPLLPSSLMLRKKNLPILLLSRSVLSRQRSDPLLSDQM